MVPIASGAHSWRARGFIATAQIASTSRKVPIASTTAAANVPPSSGLIVRGAVVAGAALVEQEPLDQQRAEHGARELGEDVDDRVDRVDPPRSPPPRASPPG